MFLMNILFPIMELFILIRMIYLGDFMVQLKILMVKFPM